MSTYKDVDWILVLGCNNSGTTLIDNILRRHPDIDCLPREGQFCCKKIYPTAVDGGVGRVWTQKPNEYVWDETTEYDAKDLLEHWFSIRMKGGERRFMMEKSPPHATKSRWFQKYIHEKTGKYPYFICVVRNGYAVAEGTIRRCREERGETRTYAETATHWSEVNRILLEDMKHLKKSVLFKYEDIGKNYNDFRQVLGDFLGLDPLSFPEKRHIVMRFNHRHALTIGIKNFNRAQIDKMSIDDIRTVNEHAGPMLKQLGYYRDAREKEEEV